MKKVHIWLFIISLFSPLWTNAQELVQEANEEIIEVAVDTFKRREKKAYTIRFGIDLSKPVMAQMDKDYFGLEFVGDIRLFSEFYGAIELGNERKTQQSERINFTTSGTYVKLGFDYNMYESAKSCVKDKGVVSEYFESNVGVRQGGNLSSLLFPFF